MSALPRLLHRVQREETVELRADALHAGGMAIGLGAFALSAWATEAGSRQAAWVALVGVIIGMVLYLRDRRRAVVSADALAERLKIRRLGLGA